MYVHVYIHVHVYIYIYDSITLYAKFAYIHIYIYMYIYIYYFFQFILTRPSLVNRSQARNPEHEVHWLANQSPSSAGLLKASSKKNTSTGRKRRATKASPKNA